ncbi:MAG: DUF2306 domain-containing protein [Bacteroidota bacterium]
MKLFFSYLINGIGLLFLSLFTILMLDLILPYFSMNLQTDFLRTKLDVIHLKHWRWSFFVHVFTSLFVLIAGFTQFSRWIMNHQPLIHRRMGQLYVAVILLFSGPSGLIMAFYANGGTSSKISFVLLAGLWWTFTWQAYRTALQKQWPKHGQFMVRSFALSLSAITLRVIMFIMGPFQIDHVALYTWAAWLSWTINLVLAEALIYTGYVNFLLKRPRQRKVLA